MSTPREVVPLAKNSTWVTPLSSLASAVMLMVPVTVAPSAGEVIATVGGASTAASTVTVMESLPLLPTLSVATAVMVWSPAPAAEASQETV